MNDLLRQVASRLNFRASDAAVASPEVRHMVFPGCDWERMPPEALGLDTKRLDRAMSYLARKSGRQGTTEAVVIKNGYLVWAGDESDTRHDVWSCTKSFTSAVLGVLIYQGACTLNTLAAEYLPELKSGYSGLRLVDFATMTSGYDGGGHQSSTPFRPTQALFEPGTRFCYWDSAMNQFANILSQISRRPLKDIFQEYAADPIGLKPDDWDWGDFGVVNGVRINGGAGNKGRGVKISARQLARLGHLFLNRGDWGGTHVISCDWAEAATRVQVPSSVLPFNSKDEGPGVYGYNWWVNGVKPDGRRLWHDVAPGAYAAKGFNNNICLVIPEWQMVVVRLGQDGNVDNRTYGRFMSLLGRAHNQCQQSLTD